MLLFVQLNVLQVVRGGLVQRQPAEHAPGGARLQPAPWADPDGRRRDPRRSRCRRTIASTSSASTRRTTCSPTSPASSPSPSEATASSGPYNDVLAGRTDSQRVLHLELVVRGRDRDRRRHAEPPRRRAAGGQGRARRSAGCSGRARPADGAILAVWSFPSYDPNLLATHDFEAADAARQALLAAPGKPLRARLLPERYFPGSTFKIVTCVGGPAERRGHAREPELPGGDELHAAADHEAHRELRRRGLRWHAVQHPAGLVQHRLRADGRRPRSRDHGRRGGGLRLQREAPDRPARPRRVVLPAGGVLRPQHAGAGPVGDRPERRAGDPARDGARRRRRGERRRRRSDRTSCKRCATATAR